MATVSAKWHKVHEAEILQRSSHVVAVVNREAHIFGGELRPREPRDNDLHILSLGEPPSLSIQTSSSQCPSPRVGSASTTLHGKIYVFSGRGGVSMGPIEENGSLWEFDPRSSAWSLISPMNSPPNSYPPARSYHSMTSDGTDTIYLHAGCPEQGRLSDFWAFSISTSKWTQLPPAPGPSRGGTSIAFAEGTVYRMNGFDGQTEQGGCIDSYSPEENVWSSFVFVPDGKSGPTPRSVSSLLPVKIDGNAHLVTLFGERDPSSLGHQGAGKMLSDVWTFDIAGQTWNRVEFVGGVLPAARGWFAADNIDKDKILVQGGLGESNERLGDAWSLSFL